ncbi:unnamed protein product [Phytophthora lilii]|uniref:Unnamed protein product n=1 Tax=Phytophthora lilii TaxID=2077276 RepID=A0A9W7CSL8_9STRA|nr:unnamed protein product [Phytophthora lilii]
MRVPNALDPSSYTTPSEQMHRLMFLGSKVVKKPQGCSTDYQWIPTDFEVGEGGEAGSDRGNVAVRILSYINNLHPEQHADLYESIGSIFGRFVPLFEPIVKFAEIILSPDKPKYSGGAWHIEGYSITEDIGSGIYCFDCENMKSLRLCFRAEVEEPPYQQNDDDGVAEIYGLLAITFLVQELGSVESSTSRCIVFPNEFQHQVQPFELEDPSRPGTRKILAFFLVDPDSSIPSTSVIPPQQRY